MSLSIVLLSFNQEQYILHSLESIFHQELLYHRGKEIQLIIADDASTDKTFLLESLWVEFHREYFKEIIVLPSDIHRGINQNFIRALRLVSEKYVRFVAGDDLLADLDLLGELSDADINIFSFFVFQGSNIYHSVTQPSLYSYYSFWGESVERIRRYSRVIFPLTLLGMIFKRQFIDETLLERLSHYSYLEDRPLWDRCIQKPKLELYYSNRPILLHRKSKLSISADKSTNVFSSAYQSDRVAYWQSKQKYLSIGLESFSAKLYELQIRFPNCGFIRYLNPYSYFRAYRKWANAQLIGQHLEEMDCNYWERNQKYLQIVLERAKRMQCNLLDDMDLK